MYRNCKNLAKICKAFAKMAKFDKRMPNLARKVKV